jgi:site-specific DNA recombinase
VWSDAPAIITVELVDKAQLQRQRHADAARKVYQPTSRRYLLRTHVKCGECGLGMSCNRQRSACKKYQSLYSECKGHSPLTAGRAMMCTAKRVRADRLDAVVWQALGQLLRHPHVIPHLHQAWAEAKQQNLSALEAPLSPLLQRQQRVERQDQRLLEAYQAEVLTLSALQMRRQKLSAELHQIEQERRQLARTRQQRIHWQQVIDHAETFCQLLGHNLEQLSFEESQAIAHCLISKVIVTAEAVDIHYVRPCESAPRVAPGPTKAPEGTPGDFYRLRLADFNLCTPAIHSAHFRRWQRQASGRVVLGALADDYDLEAPSQPAAVGPVGMAPIGPQGLAKAVS